MAQGGRAQTERGFVELKRQNWKFGEAKVARISGAKLEKMDLDRKRTPEIYRGPPLNLWLNTMGILKENT